LCLLCPKTPENFFLGRRCSAQDSYSDDARQLHEPLGSLAVAGGVPAVHQEHLIAQKKLTMCKRTARDLVDVWVPIARE
jgi:hypothetical protein